MAQPSRSALFLGLALLVAAPALATTVQGDIDTDTTWNTAGSPYDVVEDITIRSNATLTIEPGVTVRLNELKSIFVDPGCTLRAEGTAQDTITFTRAQVGNWGVLGSKGTMIFRHCLLEWGYFNIGDYSAMIAHIFGTTIIEDCTIQHAINGTEFEGGTVEFRRNLVQLINQQGYVSWSHCSQVVEDNHIQNTQDDAFDISEVNGAEITFRRNVVENIGDDALDIDFWQFATIEDFEAYNINDKGVDVSTNSTSVVAQNVIIVHAHSGYLASRRSNLTCYNCVAYDCDRGFVSERPDGNFLGGIVYVVNCIAGACDADVYVQETGEMNIIYSIINTSNPGPGTLNVGAGVLNADPRFLNPANRDFRLAYNSPAIDAGFSDGPPDHDIRGRAREDDPNTPDTGGPPFFFPRYWDIGAHEFDPSLIGVGDTGAPSIARLGLRAFPSPAAGPMGIALDVPHAGRVEVGVYDVAGRLIQMLHSGALPAGAHHVTWDGTGAIPGSGVYFIRLQEGDEQAIQKVVRVR